VAVIVRVISRLMDRRSQSGRFVTIECTRSCG
jgi:hypothetical protein